MKLTNPTDDELNAAFAEKVAGWRCYNRVFHNGRWHDVPTWMETKFVFEDGVCPPGTWIGSGPPHFTRSMDAVLPWMFGKTWSAQEHLPGFGYTVEVRDELTGDVSGRSSGEGSCLPRACVIALLRAHGVEVIFK